MYSYNGSPKMHHLKIAFEKTSNMTIGSMLSQPKIYSKGLDAY